jgi:murein DD-endopeptidase MepM/ murein hydrolase activator NlpD
LPLGTKVLSLVDGEVAKVEKLYSNDYTVMVMSKGSDLMFETEHVINPKVKVGDMVKGGDVIAEVSTHDSHYHPGFGILEIGILKGGNPPQHLCPFQYLDESIKEDTFTKIKALYKGWEDYRGDTSIYDEANYPVPGCATLEPAAG